MADEPAASSWASFTLELLVALLKHSAKSLAGDEAVQVVLEKAAELGGGKAKEAALKLLPDSALARELRTAAQKADAYFQFAFTDPHLKELAQQLRDVLPAGEAALQTALQKIPEEINEDDLREVIKGVFDPRHLPGVSAADQEALTEGYLGVLRAALIDLPEYRDLITGWAVLRTERNVRELRQEMAQLIRAFQTAQTDERASANLLKRMRDERLKIGGTANDLSVDGSVYKSIVLVGNNNEIRVVKDDSDGLARQILERCQVEALLLQGLDEISSMAFYVKQVGRFMQQIDFFGGRSTPLAVREEQLANLDAWYHDPSIPYALLLGLPAVGKSTLLLSWARKIRDDVIYIPLSLDLNIVSEEYFFKALGARLHVIYPDKPTALHSSAEDWKNYCADCLSTSPPGEKSLLVILDGLEQGENSKFMYRGILPDKPPAGLKVLGSACLSHGQQAQEDQEWLERLGLSDAGIVRSFYLSDLDHQEVMTCLQNAGLHLPEEQIERFWHHTRGQPLVVQLLTQSMMSRRDFMLPPPKAPVEIPKLKDALEHLWKLNLDPRHLANPGELNDLVDLLTCANGPLMARDLRTLSKDSLRGLNHVEGLVTTCNRLVVGVPGDAFQLAHPRLKEYLYNRLQKQDPDRCLEISGRFEELVREALTKAIEGKYNQVSAYTLRYASAHVREIADLERLASVDWLRAWRANLPNEMDVYLNRMGEVAQAARAVKDIGLQTRCALLIALADSWEPVQDDPARLLDYLASIPNPTKRAERLLAHLAGIPRAFFDDVLSLLARLDAIGKNRLLPEVARYAPRYAYRRLLSLCNDLPYESLRAFALQGMAPFLPADYFEEMWQAARGLQRPAMRLETQAALLAGRPEQTSLVEEMIASLAEISDFARQLAALGRALARLSEPVAKSVRRAAWPRLAESAGEDLTAQGDAHMRALTACPFLAEVGEIPALLAAIRGLPDREGRDQALSGLVGRQAQVGDGEAAAALIAQIESPARREVALRKLRGQTIPVQESAPELEASANAKVREASTALAFALIPWLPADRLNDALAFARKQPRLQQEDWLAAIAVRQARLGHVPQALETIRNIADTRRAGAWVEIVLGLVADEQYNEAYGLVQRIPNDGQRDRVLWRLASALAGHGQPDAADLALLVAEEMDDPGYKTGCLVLVAASLPLDLRKEAIGTARGHMGAVDLTAERVAHYEGLFTKSPIWSTAPIAASIDLRASKQQIFGAADPRQALRMIDRLAPALCAAAESDRDGALVLIQDLLEYSASLPYAGCAAVLTACLPAIMSLTSGEALAGNLFRTLQDTLLLTG